jgi:hypothetical protein
MQHSREEAEMKRAHEDKDLRIRELEEKVKKLQAINHSLKGGRSKKNSLRLDLAISGSGSIHVNESACDPFSHYTSIGGTKEEVLPILRKSQDQSFHSIGSKKSKSKRDLSAKRDKNNRLSAAGTPHVPTPANMEGT